MPLQIDPNELHQIIDNALLRFSDPTGQVLNVLNEIQTHYRYLPEVALSYLSERTGIPYTKLYSIGSFFEDLSFDPVGQYLIKVCDGTACHTQGAPELVQALEEKLGIKVGETTPDGMFTLRTVHCVGACGLAPIIIVDDKTLGRVALKEVSQIVRSLE